MSPGHDVFFRTMRQISRCEIKRGVTMRNGESRSVRSLMEIARGYVRTTLGWRVWMVVVVMMGVMNSNRRAAQEVIAQVPVEDARNTDIVTTTTHMAMPEFESLKAWE